MKKSILIVLLFCIKQINAQPYVLVTDANFVTYLQGIIPAAMHGDSLNTTSTLVTSTTKTINVRAKSIANLSGLEYFASLTYLDCSQNSLTGLPVLTNSLQTLWCSDNDLTSLPALPTSLIYLYCDTNTLSSLPALPNKLVVLSCGFNQLTGFPAFPKSLEYVYCCANNLTGLPTLPISLNYLNCTENSLASVPPSLPNSIQYLYLGDNDLTSLPALPNQLEYFSCDYNYLTSLPTLPSTLQFFICFVNSITTLPPLPPSLFYFDCGYNKISCFPVFPNDDGFTTFNIDPNPYNCLPNYIAAMGSDTVTYPICSTGNSNGCAVALSIEKVANNSQVTIYPNPASTSFQLTYTGYSGQADINVYDVNGKMVLNQTINGKTTIDTGSLLEGVYNINIIGNGGLINKRLVIVR